MMPPPSYVGYPRSADHHLQVEVVAREVPGEHPGEFPVTVRVRRVFRSCHGIRENDELRFGLKVYRRPQPVAPDAGGWLESTDFQRLRYLEVFLTGAPDELSVAAFGALRYPIDELTDRPTVPRPGRFGYWLALARWRLGLRVDSL